MQHPEKGKVIDLSDATRKQLNSADPSIYVKIYPVDGYGNADIVRQIMDIEKPDAIMHFTDPRYWTWLYQIEHEIRQKIPLIYYEIWDSQPAPKYNRSFYESCDALLAISKQTEIINKIVLPKENWYSLEDLKNPNFDPSNKTLILYVPHGSNKKVFKPLDKNDSLLVDFKKKYFGNKEYDFILLYNNRNIHRKHPADIMVAYKLFCDSLTPEQKDKVLLVFKTQKVDHNGYDLPAVQDAMCDNCNIKYIENNLSPEEMNCLYNISDVTINMSSNEGFGIATCESLTTGTPIIANVTGGLQDQLGFVDDNGNPIEFDFEWGSNHDGRYKKHGVWGIAVFPTSRSISGSIPTPYISDERNEIEDIAEAIKIWYKVDKESRKKAGEIGRQWVLNGKLNSDYMCSSMDESIETVFKNWKPRKKFELFKTKSLDKKTSGMAFRSLNEEKIQNKVDEIINKLK